MSDKNWDLIKSEILARLNIESECQMMGVQFSGKPSAKGWWSCLNPYKPERYSSAGINIGSGGNRGYLVTFNNAGGIRFSINFFDFARDLNPALSGYDFKEVIAYYAEKTGVDTSGKVDKPPTANNIEFYQDSLTNEVRNYLRDNRGINEKSIEKYQIG